MLRLWDIVYRIKVICFQRVSPRCMLEGWGTGAFLLYREDGFAYEGWAIRGNYATKSTLAECVKRFCLGCIEELLATFLEIPRVASLTEANGGYKYGFPKCSLFYWGGGRVGRGSGVRSAVHIQAILHMND